ncbi:SIS domain-containing protein [Thermoanaerobacterium thermosaccharolyticum]|uniref:sugar isomerase domain-containing protein n=1 Tax=Thermoanaerobacterium thermosaccharolyticum TaxID=1517 RepID=UPI0027A25FEA|nr:SIS domain-containing protein [Thermoanaerobacterium thermosaccharolyticum]
MKSLEYLSNIKEKIDEIFTKQKDTLIEIENVVANCIEKGGIVDIFGCGHSHIFAEETFYRAGGLACINPILEPVLMLHEGAEKSSKLERMNYLGEIIYDNFNLRKEDVLFVFSTSGRNPVSIDFALKAKSNGITTVAITSIKYSNAYDSKHVSGKKLYEVVDYYIDNMCDVGDASINIEGLNTKMGPTSTVIGAMIINGIFIDAAEKLVKRGIEVPVFISGNIDGSDEYNKSLINKYKPLIKLL